MLRRRARHVREGAEHLRPGEAAAHRPEGRDRSHRGPDDRRRPRVLKEGIGLTEVRMTGAGPVVRNVEHVALKVEDINRLVKTLQVHDIPIVDGPKPSAYGTTLYVLDPDGNRIECHD
ncbi:MAG: VOC family protein [Deltaproteobacteria bacterium]|nr:VOC family protein [Deltaproteobacteria bacterium]